MVAEYEEKNNSRTLIFTYGTLKRGFSNHTLIQDMSSSGDAKFIGIYTTADPHPLVCGPFRVPFLLRFPGSGNRVTGELYSISNRGLARMDELEGTSRGHYERLPIKIVRVEKDEIAGLEGTNHGHYERLPVEETNNGCVEKDERSPIKIWRIDERERTNGWVDKDEMISCAEAYFAHDSYAKELWMKCGEKGFGCYSEKEARGYVKRGDRPRDLSFLQQINKFVSN